MYSTSWCGFCSRLKAALNARGIRYAEIDVDDDPAAAEFVSSVNGGNRTVPTLRFSDDSTLTNPGVRQVMGKLSELGESAQS
jgi:mycoredoxin